MPPSSLDPAHPYPQEALLSSPGRESMLSSLRWRPPGLVITEVSAATTWGRSYRLYVRADWAPGVGGEGWHISADPVNLCVCVYMCVFLCVCLFVSVCLSMNLSECLYVCLCVYACVTVCLHICMFACLYVCLPV